MIISKYIFIILLSLLHINSFRAWALEREAKPPRI